jgi:hypothetical protein
MPMPFLPDLRGVPTSALTQRLYDIRDGERALLVEFLANLAELDGRRDFLDLGFRSCFAFLCEHLGYTRSSAYRRTTAARIFARFPVVADHLADGRLCLTTLVELRDVLCEERLDEILERAAGRTEDQIKELVAALRPRPALPDLFRRLPDPRPRLPVDSSGPEQSTAPLAPPSPPEPPPRPRVEPISEELRVLRITVGRDFVADLEAVRSALSHVLPDGNLAKVIHECLRRTRRELERRHNGAAERPRPPSPSPPDGRGIPAAVRREV